MPCYIEKNKSGVTMFLCGDLGPHCAACAASSDYLCDYPVGDGVTCDLPLCASHASEIAPNLHYCPAHLALWKEFKDSGGVRKVLENVTPYKREPTQKP